MPEDMTFAPRPSWGWLWPLALIAFLALPLFAMTFDPAAREDPVGMWVALAVTIPLAIYMFVVVFAFPTMRYELTADTLDLVYWPLRYRIPYAKIESISREDLVPSLWSSMRFPGLAVGKVPYVGRRAVVMCSTRAAHGVVIIHTADRDYGVSPAEESAFVEAVIARIPPER